MPGVMEDDEDNGDDTKQCVSKEVTDSTLDESDYFTDGFGATFLIRPQRRFLFGIEKIASAVAALRQS